MSISHDGGAFPTMPRSFSLQSTKDCRVKLPCLAENPSSLGTFPLFKQGIEK